MYVCMYVCKYIWISSNGARCVFVPGPSPATLPEESTPMYAWDPEVSADATGCGATDPGKHVECVAV